MGRTAQDKRTAVERRRGRPSARDTQRNSEALIGVATDFFVEHGFGGTTIEAVAQAANVGRQAVYTRFTDKEALFNAVIRRLQETPVFERLALSEEQPLEEGLAERLRAIFTDAARPEAMNVSKLAVREGHRFPDLIELMAREVHERFIRPMARYLSAHQRAGHTRDIDAGETAALLMDMVLSEINRAVCTNSAMSEAQIEAAVARIAGLGLQAILRPDADAENARLKKLLADAMLENAALKERIARSGD